jgi:hypothetical protein
MSYLSWSCRRKGVKGVRLGSYYNGNMRLISQSIVFLRQLSRDRFVFTLMREISSTANFCIMDGMSASSRKSLYGITLRIISTCKDTEDKVSFFSFSNGSKTGLQMSDNVSNFSVASLRSCLLTKQKTSQILNYTWPL